MALQEHHWGGARHLRRLWHSERGGEVNRCCHDVGGELQRCLQAPGVALLTLPSGIANAAPTHTHTMTPATIHACPCRARGTTPTVRAFANTSHALATWVVAVVWAHRLSCAVCSMPASVASTNTCVAAAMARAKIEPGVGAHHSIIVHNVAVAIHTSPMFFTHTSVVQAYPMPTTLRVMATSWTVADPIL